MKLERLTFLPLLALILAACPAVVPTPAPTPDFAISSAPASISLAQGSSGNLTINLERQNGFADAVAITLTSPPTGLGAASLNIPAGSSTGVLNLTAAAALALGDSTVTINASSGSLLHTSSLALTVTALPVNNTPDFSFTITPSSLDLSQDGSGSVTVNLTRLNGFGDPVTFSLSNPIAGVSAAVPLTIPSGSNAGSLTILAAPTTALGSSNLTINATSGNLNHTSSLALNINAGGQPNFAVSLESLTSSLMQAGTTDVMVNLSRQNGFKGLVVVTLSNLPTGVLASALTIPAGSNSGTLTLSAEDTSPLGTSTVIVTGTGGNLTRTASLALSITPFLNPDFGLSLTPSSIAFQQGGNASVTVNLARTGGFTGAVNLSLSSPTVGIAATPITVAAGATSGTLIVASLPSVPVGPLNLTVTGSSAGLTHNVTLPLNVTLNTTPGFYLTPSPTSLSIVQGSNKSVTVTVTRTGGFTGAVDLSVANLPANVTASSLTLPSGASIASLSVNVSALASIGTFSLNVTGIGAGLTKTAPLSLNVSGAPDFLLNLLPSSLNLFVVAGVTGQVSVNVTPVNGFGGPVVITLKNPPVGVSAAPLTVQSGSSGNLILSTSNATPLGLVSLEVVGTAGVVKHSAFLALTLLGP